MYDEVIYVFAYVYCIAWFIWPVAFVFGLAHGINELMQNNKVYNKGLIVASIALTLILAGLLYSSF